MDEYDDELPTMLQAALATHDPQYDDQRESTHIVEENDQGNSSQQYQSITQTLANTTY